MSTSAVLCCIVSRSAALKPASRSPSPITPIIPNPDAIKNLLSVTEQIGIIFNSLAELQSGATSKRGHVWRHQARRAIRHVLQMNYSPHSIPVRFLPGSSGLYKCTKPCWERRRNCSLLPHLNAFPSISLNSQRVFPRRRDALNSSTEERQAPCAQNRAGSNTAISFPLLHQQPCRGLSRAVKLQNDSVASRSNFIK